MKVHCVQYTATFLNYLHAPARHITKIHKKLSAKQQPEGTDASTADN